MEFNSRGKCAVILALTYRRVSRPEQAKDGLSLGVQRARCRHYVDELGWKLERGAAPGVDGEAWRHYGGEDLEEHP